MKIFKDLFYGLGNVNADLARVLAAWAVGSYSFAFLWALIRNGATLDFSALGIGYAAILAGAGALILAKDSARTAAVSAAATPPESNAP